MGLHSHTSFIDWDRVRKKVEEPSALVENHGGCYERDAWLSPNASPPPLGPQPFLSPGLGNGSTLPGPGRLARGFSHPAAERAESAWGSRTWRALEGHVTLEDASALY